ncbi:MAG TPA: NAD-dependent epimerase [Deltaproteobacteria bacterium]|nr:NAD-dependent epimerase [Deltaproteobacteria bacterium]
MKKILITGVAGFIGYHLADALARLGKIITGIDNLNDYYDVKLKKARLVQLERYDNFKFRKLDLADRKKAAQLFDKGGFDVVVNLAAQAGVRYSLKNPYSYIESNIVGFTNVLEGCRHNGIKHLVFASSSSVYGLNTKVPFSVHDNIDHPISLYAASKKANELMAHAYAHLYAIPSTGLRFFTVYGPWGRPDMAYFSFTKSILEGKPIDVYNFGNMKRDFTYIDDIVEGVIMVMENIPRPNPDWDTANPKAGSSYAPYKLYNIGNNNPVELKKFIEILEEKLGKKAVKNMLPMQPGDVPLTYADIDDLVRDVGFRPKTSLEDGIEKFVTWYRSYYNVK